MRPFYVIVFGLAVVSMLVFALLMYAGVDDTVARYASGALFLIPTAIAGHFYVPGPNKMMFWAVVLGSFLLLVIRG